LFALAAVAVSSAPAVATTITFSGSGPGAEGASLAAQAIFEFAGDTLTVTLINIATSDNTSSDKDVPANTLTGVFFNLTGNPTLIPGSATITAGSMVLEPGVTCDIGPCDEFTTNVGGEFRYGTGAFPGGAGHAIASSGYGDLGAGNFGGPNLDDPNAVDGINFGIISNDPSFEPNGGLLRPLIQNQVVFILTGVNDLIDVDGLSIPVSNVSFQYGTSLTEPRITGDCVDCTQDTPEPTTLLLLGWGLAALGLYRRRPV
jgi:hypothetical protein